MEPVALSEKSSEWTYDKGGTRNLWSVVVYEGNEEILDHVPMIVLVLQLILMSLVVFG